MLPRHGNVGIRAWPLREPFGSAGDGVPAAVFIGGASVYERGVSLR